MNRTELDIVKRTPRRELDSLTLCSFPWKSVVLAVDGWNEKEIELIKKVLGFGSVQSLELHGTCDEDKLSGGKLLDADQLSQCLCQPSNLKSLNLDIGILIRFPSVLGSSKVQNRLCGLENLMLLPYED